MAHPLISRLHREAVDRSLLCMLLTFCTAMLCFACLAYPQHSCTTLVEGVSLIGPPFSDARSLPPRFAYGWTEMAALDVFGHRVRGDLPSSVRPPVCLTVAAIAYLVGLRSDHRQPLVLVVVEGIYLSSIRNVTNLLRKR